MTPFELGERGATSTNRRLRFAVIASVGGRLPGVAYRGAIGSKCAGAATPAGGLTA
jgi:hypothetical protein